MMIARGVKGAGRLRRIGENCPSHPPPASSLSQPVPITGEQSCILPYQAQSLSPSLTDHNLLPSIHGLPRFPSFRFRLASRYFLWSVLSLSLFRFETTFAVLLGHRSTLSWSGWDFPLRSDSVVFLSFCFLSFSFPSLLVGCLGDLEGVGWMGWDGMRCARFAASFAFRDSGAMCRWTLSVPVSVL